MMSSARKFFVFFVFLFLFNVKKVWATCTVSVIPGSVVRGVSSSTTFTISNTGEQLINWVRIQMRFDQSRTEAFAKPIPAASQSAELKSVDVALMVVIVEILNGTKVAGLAKKESERLKLKDPTLKLTVGNSPEDAEATTISYREKGFEKSSFGVLAGELWPGAIVKTDPGLSVDARVVLGENK